MIRYLTFNDNLSGIYESQVVDVVNYLNQKYQVNIRLVAFVPWNRYKETKSKLKEKCIGARVFPILLGITRWKINIRWYKLISSRKSITIARGPLAYEMAYRISNRVIYDGRAAVKAEIDEYDVTGSERLNVDFKKAEELAVKTASFRIAVSEKLVEYWRSEFGYEELNHVVIPCTLNNKVTLELVSETAGENVKLVYSGGTSGWQSFGLVTHLIREALKKQTNLHVLFLTREVQEITDLINEFPGRCERKWLSHSEVGEHLKKCDYGILIRDDKVTNRVASPVKFAEYLNAGLSILISKNLGDFSDFVYQNECGEIVTNELPKLKQVPVEKKRENQELCSKYFYKESKFISEKYQKLVDHLN